MKSEDGQFDLTASVHTAFLVQKTVTLSQPVSSTSGVPTHPSLTGFVVPKGFIGVHLRVDVPCGSFVKLIAGVGEEWSAPESQEEAVVRIPI